MATFTNQATLIYNGQSTSSNVTTGELITGLTLTKTAITNTYAKDGSVTYIVTISNAGAAVVATDNIVVQDTFNPILNPITVTLDGSALTDGVDYTYNALTGDFATTPGVITVPAATYVQDPVSGVYSMTPGVATLVVSGTV